MKTCIKCKMTKPLSEFRTDSRMADGYIGQCKACTKIYMKVYVAAYRKSEGGKAIRRANNQRQRAKYPEKDIARHAVSNAIRSGRLIKQPCAICGESRVEGHHHDYRQPLSVTWLCSQHHREAEEAEEVK